MVGVPGATHKPQTVWDRVPDEYLWYYFLDLAYVDLQPDLFRHLFPACLKYWYDTLMRNEEAPYGDGDFHYALLRGQIPEKMLSDSELQSLWDFFRDGFPDRIEAERGFIYSTRSELSRQSQSGSGKHGGRWTGQERPFARRCTRRDWCIRKEKTPFTVCGRPSKAAEAPISRRETVRSSTGLGGMIILPF